MIYLKTYCYSEHELEFIIAQLIESEGYVDKVIVYEYNVTHRGEDKPFRLQKLVDTIKPNLKRRLIYRPVDIKCLCVRSNDPEVIHSINEPIQRSYFFNDQKFNLKDTDIIFDVDVDEIIYKRCYQELIRTAKFSWLPIGIKLNQFFYKTNYHWVDATFNSPTVYRIGAFFKRVTRLNNGFILKHQRDLHIHYPRICGAHLSWIMPVEMMVRKLHSYSHPEYEKYADREILNQAIERKQYIFDLNRKFTIDELPLDSNKIPIFFRKQ